MRLGSRELAQAPFSAVSAPIGAIDFPAQNSRAGVTTQLRARRSVSRRTDPRLEPFCAIEYSTSKKSELHSCISRWGWRGWRRRSRGLRFVLLRRCAFGSLREQCDEVVDVVNRTDSVSSPFGQRRKSKRSSAQVRGKRKQRHHLHHAKAMSCIQ